MKMNKIFKQTGLVAAMALTISACGGDAGSPNAGGSDTAGIGGSGNIPSGGFVSLGTITGFGSVIVNGVSFETAGTEFDIDGVRGIEDDLGVGMIVKVEGTINNDGVTGVATNISFDDELQGPVASITAFDPNSNTRNFTVLGTTVIVDSQTTVFDKDDDISAITIFNFERIANNDNIEISGHFNTVGELLATRIELKDDVFDSTSTVEIKGVIAGLNIDRTEFQIGSITVAVLNAQLDDIPENTLANGQEVAIKGTFDSATNTITATKIEFEDDNLPDTKEIEIEGIITDFISESDFKVNGIVVNASNTIFKNNMSASNLKNNLQIEVEGEIKDGVLIAKEIEFEDGNIEVSARISSIAADNQSFMLNISGTELKVKVTSGTQFADNVNYNAPRIFNINNLVVDSFVEVEGKNHNENSFTATYVSVEYPGDVAVQGYVEAFAEGVSIKVLGVTFNINTETELNGTIDPNDFSSTLVSIEDELVSGVTDGIADEIKVETND